MAAASRPLAPGRARARAGAALVAALALGAAPAARVGPEAPARIISIVPAATEMLFAIGAGPQVVGVSSFDREPAEVARLPRVGGLIDPDLERIFALRPDLVIVYATQTELQAQLARAAIPVFRYSHGGLAEVTATIRELGTRTGHADQAGAVADRIEADLAALRARLAGRPRPRTLLVFGRDPGALRNVYASGGVGFLHDMLEAAGGANVFADIRREAVQATSETILAMAPDVILELHPGAPVDAGRERAAWQAVSAVPAVRQGRVHVLSGSDLVVPGPRVAAATLRLARALHPGAFEP